MQKRIVMHQFRLEFCVCARIECKLVAVVEGDYQNMQRVGDDCENGW